MKEARDPLLEFAAIHKAEFDIQPEFVVAVPGIVRILGEHTIEVDGISLSIPLSLQVMVAVSQRRDTALRCYAHDLNERKRITMNNLKYKKEDRWANLVKSVLYYCLGNDETYYNGFNVTISDSIPAGLGLGNTHTILAALLLAFSNILRLDLNQEDMIKLILQIEHSYFGRNPSQDQIQSIFFAQPDALLYIDAYKSWREPLPFSMVNKSLVLIDSQVPRINVENEHKKRFEECSTIINLLKKKSFREITAEDLDEILGAVPETSRRHCLFLHEEIIRIKEIREQIHQRDITWLSKHINKSQQGLRNYYEISCPEIDWLSKHLLETKGVYCARMIGNGFGGCMVAIADDDIVNSIELNFEDYERIFGFHPKLYICKAGKGVSVQNIAEVLEPKNLR